MEMAVVRKVTLCRRVELCWLAASTIKVSDAGRNVLWNVFALPLHYKELRTKWEQLL